jgi:uncharacterized membrane protein YphA (DoxX/SURF4 family)
LNECIEPTEELNMSIARISNVLVGVPTRVFGRPAVAAVAGTTGELVFPLLLFVGLASRLSALGLFAVNVMAVVSYTHVLLTEGFEAALAQHYLWGFALLVLVVFGPGKLSLDYLGARHGGQLGMARPAHAV